MATAGIDNAHDDGDSLLSIELCIFCTCKPSRKARRTRPTATRDSSITFLQQLIVEAVKEPMPIPTRKALSGLG